MLAALTLQGCGGTQDLAKYAEAGRDLAQAAEPCLVAQKDAALAQCQDAPCRDQVYQAFSPIADALDLMHKAWCRVAPNAEGC
jgi:hypothetical protein